MKTIELLMLLRMLSEMIALFDRAIWAGQNEVSVEDLASAFERVRSAEASWARTLHTDGEQTPERP